MSTTKGAFAARRYRGATTPADTLLSHFSKLYRTSGGAGEGTLALLKRYQDVADHFAPIHGIEELEALAAATAAFFKRCTPALEKAYAIMDRFVLPPRGYLWAWGMEDFDGDALLHLSSALTEWEHSTEGRDRFTAAVAAILLGKDDVADGDEEGRADLQLLEDFLVVATIEQGMER